MGLPSVSCDLTALNTQDASAKHTFIVLFIFIVNVKTAYLCLISLLGKVTTDTVLEKWLHMLEKYTEGPC